MVEGSETLLPFPGRIVLLLTLFYQG